MKYTRLGSSWPKIRRNALGGMSFGDPTRGGRAWVVDDAASEPLFRQAVELGSTLWDTANIYADDTSEELVGRAIRTYTPRRQTGFA